MRVLDAALTAAQRASTREAYLRVHLDDRGGTTVTYTTRDGTNRIHSIRQWEESWAGVTVIRLKNHDQSLSTADYRGYSVTVGWGLVLTGSPDPTWYSNAATMKVINQRDISYGGELLLEIYCVSVWAEQAADYIWEGGKKIPGAVTGTFAIGELVTGSVSGATGRLAYVGADYIIVTRVTGTFKGSAPWDTCTGGTSSATLVQSASPSTNYGDLVYASGDTTTEERIEALTSLTVDVDQDDPDSSMADTPKLEVEIGTSVRATVRRMMLRTKCGLRLESDGHLHALYLNTATAAQYEFQSTHAFFEDLRDRAIIIPNTVYFADASPATYVGTANDATSVAAIGTFVAPPQIDPDITSDAEGNTRASAWIAQMLAQAYQGRVTAPMECGLEVYDMAQCVDARLNVTSKGRAGRVERVYEPETGTYDIILTLGSLYSEPGAMNTGPGAINSDLTDLTDSLDSSPPKVVSSINVWDIGPALLPITIDVDFTATDNDDVTWGAGTITFADKTTQVVDAGSLNLANTNPYYLYATKDDTSLNNSQTFGDAVGNNNFLIAFLKKAPQANQKALIIPASGGKSPTFNQDVVSANCITASEIYVSQLSAIAADMGLLTAGEVRVGTGTLGIDFTGWRLWVESSVGRFAGYASDTMQFYSDTDGKLYAGGGSVYLDASGITVKGNFLIFQHTDGVTKGSMYAGSSDLHVQASSDINLDLETFGTGDIILDSHDNVLVESAAAGYIHIEAGSSPGALTDGCLGLGASVDIEMVAGNSVLIRSATGISVRAGSSPTTPTLDDLRLEADDEVLIKGTDRVGIGAGGNATPAADEVEIQSINGNVRLTPVSTGRSYVQYLACNAMTAIGSTIDTIYQNTRSSPLLVAVTLGLDNGDTATFHASSSTPPTTVRGRVGSKINNQIFTMTYIVPIGWYYRIATAAGSPTVQTWNEISIGY